ncbi:hypothetical protein SARC_06228 [Sphaeroforma arctica JP610]|uniref:Uncharacterized protein n=1 Tax=Sphaeroforma arctica JP610 TaxID=667725 RepID=A0A0L0FX74_9EUKA|nr:hypothetical protein SARC_06228 [Sphaeroforma arctica JP610]KNC81437.1 hypothetical protein SARC_06228 [Sphaeroforma arctica JP610]|eukprot:XP_014155339.1 hypothetical protein SARC_06228 [Sphaeroforma arctica JP610]
MRNVRVIRRLYTLPAVSNKLFLLLTQAIGACVGAVYATILIKVNEQRYWWSEINEARKEVIFHSEQAMYYRYFKDVTDTSLPISQVFYNFLNDATVESPNVINALKRFNVWPEFLLGVSFRYFSTSEPIDYYVHTVLAWSFFLMAGIYVTATLITRNLICGLVAVAAVMGNFLDSTRVWGSVPLRESWSIPLIFSQIAVVTYVLHMSSSGQMTASESRMKRFAPFVLLYVLTTSLVLSWQLAASIMALQVAALFLTHLLGYINTQLLKHLIVCHLMSVSSVVVFMFGNEMLITSPYTITCIGALVAVMGCDCLLGSADALQFPYRLTRSFVVGMCSIAIAIATKVALHTLPFLPAGDDAHMYNLIQAKVGDFEDFHTNLYLHSEAFQMLQWHTIMRLTYTGILPMAVTGVLLVSGYILRDICTGRHSKVMYTELELYDPTLYYDRATAREKAKSHGKVR